MLCLSVRQPWAWAIIHSPVAKRKDIENRDWATKVRGRVLIHASKGMTNNEFAQAADFIYQRGIAMPPQASLARGAIIGSVEITDCVTRDWRMKYLQVRNWNEHYETSESRKVKSMSWLAVPNGHDSEEFCELLDGSEGMAHFGAWVLILQVASKCEVRGLLRRTGDRPHDAVSLARQTHGNAKVMESAIKKLLEIGWLEEVEWAPGTVAGESAATSGTNHGRASGVPGDGQGPASPTGTGQDRYKNSNKNRFDAP